MAADEMSRTVPFVCRGWREAVLGPYCWAEIDLEQWCRRVNRSDVIDSAMRRLVRRSRGNLRRLSAYRLGNSAFSYVAISADKQYSRFTGMTQIIKVTTSIARFLNILQIPMSEVTDQMVEKHAESLSALTVLDISNCLKITSKGIESLGKHCKSLIQLRRNMPPPDYEWSQDGTVNAKVDESEALSVANTMPRLEYLELAYGRFSDCGLDAILTNCHYLHVLDIRGCWKVDINEGIERKCHLIQSFKSPWYDEYEPVCSDNGDDNDEDVDGVDDAELVDVDTVDESNDETW
ncbi:F-box protein FBW2-like [Phoenix dactylifera]|uniref:F-box protein FBW2-like n=1 Tax=Phoenix dactylifera TaxID=42345 RepID=A0A8B7CG58_PHODC|nr:F-box protein FBW2-like [Phoenix dactylifera]